MYPDISQDKDKTKVKLKFYMSRFDYQHVLWIRTDGFECMYRMSFLNRKAKNLKLVFISVFYKRFGF